MELYREKKSRKFYNQKMYQKFLNESIKFLFIGQGQVDTWHHLRGLSEAYSPRNLEKIQFHTSPNKFSRLCEVENASARILSSWSILHDCTKILHGHAKSVFTSPLQLQPKSPLVHFARLCKFFACSCKIEKHGFSTSFCHFSHFFLLIPLQLPPNQLQILVQTDCIASFIMHLDHHQLYLFSSI